VQRRDVVRIDDKHFLWYSRVHGTRGKHGYAFETGNTLTQDLQILLDKKYGRAVDWWAFGVLIYQMLLQQSPFRGEDEDEIYDAILADEPLYPIHMPRDSVSILQKLLTREPEMRLGSGPTDAQEIMSHAFFRNINWDDIYHKRVPSPFIPTITSATDTSNFDTEFTSVTPVLTPVQSVLSQAMQEEFRGFSYSADFN
jgi:serine/threonine protein kinase